MDLSTKRQEVSAWLEELYGDEDVPEFELNAKTIEHLHHLMLKTREKDKNAELLIQDLQQKTDEYNAEDVSFSPPAQRISAILQRLNLGSNSLSQSGANSVKALAKLGVLLEVKDPSDTCYLLAMQYLDDELQLVQEQRQSEARHLEELTSKSRSAFLKCNALNKALDDVREKANQSHPQNEKKKRDANFLHSKMKNYEKDISKLQVQLAKTKVDKSVFHENLLKKSEILKSLQDQLEPLLSELKSYSSLPPDLAETKIRIEQQKRELAKLEKEVADCIDMSLL